MSRFVINCNYFTFILNLNVRRIYSFFILIIIMNYYLLHFQVNLLSKITKTSLILKIYVGLRRLRRYCFFRTANSFSDFSESILNFCECIYLEKRTRIVLKLKNLRFSSKLF